MCMCEKNIMTLCVSEKLINKNHRTILIVVSTINKKISILYFRDYLFGFFSRFDPELTKMTSHNIMLLKTETQMVVLFCDVECE